MRRLAALATVLFLACDSIPTDPGETGHAPLTARFATFYGEGPFSMAEGSGCVPSGDDLSCDYTIENVGDLALDIELRGSWLFQPQCVHFKTGKPAPSKYDIPFPYGFATQIFHYGATATNGSIEVVGEVIAVATPEGNPCAENKGPYTAVVWGQPVLERWFIHAQDPDLEVGYAGVYEIL